MLNDWFYILNFSLMAVSSIVTIVVSVTVIVIYVIKSNCRTFTTLLTCNISVAQTIFALNCFIISFYGFNENWAINQPLCSFRAYCFVASASAMGYGVAFQAMGRLFITVFYKYKYFTTFRVCWCMIALSWLIALLLPIVPLFFDGAYIYEKESRLCTISSKNFPMSFYVSIVTFPIPVSASMFIYGRILYYTETAHRVVPLTTSAVNSLIPNLKRQRKVARNMIIILMILIGAGTLYFILILWHRISPSSQPPEPLYLPSMNIVSCMAVVSAFVQLNSNSEIKTVALHFLRCQD